MYICSNSKYVVEGLFKIIQNYVNNKINDKKLLFSYACVSIDFAVAELTKRKKMTATEFEPTTG